MPRGRLIAATILLTLPIAPLRAQTRAPQPANGWAGDPLELASLVAFARAESDLRGAVNRYLVDKASIERRYEVPYSPARHQRLRAFYEGWQRRLAGANFDALNGEGKIDYVLLRNRVAYDLDALALAETRWKQIAPLVPFLDELRALQENRFDRKRAEPRAAATTLNATAVLVEGLTRALVRPARAASDASPPAGVTPVVAVRAAALVDSLRTIVADAGRWRQDDRDGLSRRRPAGRIHARRTGARASAGTADHARLPGAVAFRRHPGCEMTTRPREVSGRAGPARASKRPFA